MIPIIKLILSIVILLITASSIYVFGILLTAQPVNADIRVENDCIEGDPLRVTTYPFFGLELGSAHGFYYTFDIINPSGTYQVRHVYPDGTASVFFSVDAFGGPAVWNLPTTSAAQGSGTYTVRIYQVEGHSGQATLIGTTSFYLPFPPCTAPRPIAPGTLTVNLQVVGGPGIPPALPDLSEFRLQVVGGTEAEPFAPIGGVGNTVTLSPGFFRVDQLTHIPDYTVSFSGDCDSTGRGTITSGASLTCTVTDTYTTPSEGTGTLRVFNDVTNNDGGIRQPGDFTMRISGGTGVGGTYVSPNNSFGGNSRGTTITLHPGHYEVNEEPSITTQGPHASYSVRYSEECNGEIRAGETKTCTVTNDDIRQPGILVISATTLNIIKTAIPPPTLPEKGPSRYTVHIDGTSNNIRNNLGIGVGPSESQTVTIQTGRYRVYENPVPPGYTAIYSDDCSGTLTGVPIQPRTCTITNVAVNPPNMNGNLTVAQVVQQCLQDPNCIASSHIPPALVQCLQDPRCFHNLTMDTSTGMSSHLNFTKKEVITTKNKTNEATNLTNQSFSSSSKSVFNQTFSNAKKH